MSETEELNPLRIVDAVDIKYANVENTLIDCIATFSDGRTVPFSAASYDTEAHGVEAFNELASGRFGTVAPYTEPETPVPSFVSALQARRALNQVGLRDEVDAYVSTLSRDDQDTWQFSPNIHRNDPILNAGWNILGKSQKELDDLFKLAITL